MDKQIKEFQKRFGEKRIPVAILKLFFSTELYAKALNHKIGRELCCDMFFHTSDLLKKMIDIDGEGELLQAQQHLDWSKEMLNSICDTVDTCKEKDLDIGNNFFSDEEWASLYQKLKNVDRYNEERKRIHNGQVFNAAFKTKLGGDISENVDYLIEGAYKGLYNNKVNVQDVYVLGMYRAIRAQWKARRTAYMKDYEHIRKIIYKEKR